MQTWQPPWSRNRLNDPLVVFAVNGLLTATLANPNLF
jgi:hypothetical protein